MADREAKIKFTAETSDLTAQIKEANATLVSLRAELKLNEAELKNNGNAAESMRDRHRILQQELEANRSKQDALNKKLEAAKQIYGENSVEVQEWTTKLTRAKIEEEQLKTQLNETESELRQFESAADGAGNEADQLGDNMEEAGRQAEESASGWSMAKQILADLATSILRKIADGAMEAARAMMSMGMDFTSSMSNVQALSGATAEEMRQLEDTAKALGRSTIYSASQVSDAFGFMALAGWDVSDMLNGIDGVLNLAAAANMDLAKASDIVTDNLTAFGLSAEDAGLFVDQMAYAMANSNTSAEQLGEAYKNCAATANSMGFSVEDTTAALMVMANAGIKGGEAGTGLSSIMTRLGTNTKDCAKELGKYGVEVYDAQGNMNSLSSIVNGCARVWNDLTQEQQINLAKTIAGQSQYSKFATIMQGMTEEAERNGQSFNDYTEALEHCQGAAENLSSTMQDNLSGDMAALGSAAEGLGLAVFDLFEGPLRGAAQITTALLNDITDHISAPKSELETFIDDVKASNEAVKATLDNASAAMDNGLAKMSELEAYEQLLLSLNEKTELSQYEQYQLRNAVQELGDSVPGLSDAFDEASGTLTVTNDELRKMFNNAKALAMQTALIEAQGQSYKALAEATLAKAKADSAAEKAQENLDAAVEKFNNSANLTQEELTEVNEAIAENSSALEDAKAAQEDANSAMEEAQAQIEEEEAAYATLREEYGLASDSLEDLAESETAVGEAASEAQDEVSGFGNMTAQEMEAAAEAAEEAQKAYEEMRDGIGEAIDNTIDFFEEFSGGAEITAKEVLDNLNSQIDGMNQWAANMQILGEQAGSGMSQALYDKLAEMGPESATLVQALVDALNSQTGEFEAVSQAYSEALAIEAEAPDMVGAYTSAGKEAAASVGTGMEEGSGDVTEALQSSVDSAAEAMTTDSMSEKGTEAMEQMAEGVEAGAESVVSSVESMSDEVGSAVEDGFSEASSTVDSETQAMTQSAEQAGQKISQTTDTAMNEVKTKVQAGSQEVSSKVNETGSKVSADWQQAMQKMISSTNSGTASMKSSFSSMQSGVQASMNGAVSSVQSGVSRMQSALSVTLRGPNIQVPHFSMSGAFNAKTNSVPVVNVSWYKDGAVFDSATIIPTLKGMKGVGEGGEPEAVSPISVLQGYVREAVEEANRFDIDYDKLGASVANAVKKQNITIALNGREIGRAERHDGSTI